MITKKQLKEVEENVKQCREKFSKNQKEQMKLLEMIVSGTQLLQGVVSEKIGYDKAKKEK